MEKNTLEMHLHKNTPKRKRKKMEVYPQKVVSQLVPLSTTVKKIPIVFIVMCCDAKQLTRALDRNGNNLKFKAFMLFNGLEKVSVRVSVHIISTNGRFI